MLGLASPRPPLAGRVRYPLLPEGRDAGPGGHSFAKPQRGEQQQGGGGMQKVLDLQTFFRVLVASLQPLCEEGDPPLLRCPAMAALGSAPFSARAGGGCCGVAGLWTLFLPVP